MFTIDDLLESAHWLRKRIFSHSLVVIDWRSWNYLKDADELQMQLKFLSLLKSIYGEQFLDTVKFLVLYDGYISPVEVKDQLKLWIGPFFKDEDSVLKQYLK